MFENCGIDDIEFSNIITACSFLKDFKSIVYKQNQIGPLTLQLLPMLFQRKIPYHLLEFRVIDCKISVQTSNQLIDMVSRAMLLQ
jgi:hypothetical protein